MNNIINHLNILDKWFQKNDYKGYDPYDLFDTKLFHSLISTRFVLVRKVNRKLISWFIFLFPQLVIKLFNKKPNINAKAMGLLLKAYCNLYSKTKEKKYLNRSIHISDWLINNRSEGITGYGWGYPFDWSGSKFIPKYTPSSVVSTIIGDGFFSLYEITENKKYLNVCNKICIFLLRDLNIDEVDKETVCFSYTPIDNNHVINANLFTAEYLVRIGQELQDEDYVNYGIKAVNYSLKQQRDNGDFLYWGSEDSKRLRFSFSNTDHYHTGFEIRMLFKLWKLLNDDRIKIALDKYYDFYIRNFINEDFSINLFPNRNYPINIHACSEVLICNNLIKTEYSKQIKLDKIFDWVQISMLDEDGLYIYEIRKFMGIKFKNRFKFNRWSQAWMFLALSEYYKRECYEE